MKTKSLVVCLCGFLIAGIGLSGMVMSLFLESNLDYFLFYLTLGFVGVMVEVSGFMIDDSPTSEKEKK